MSQLVKIEGWLPEGRLGAKESHLAAPAMFEEWIL